MGRRTRFRFAAFALTTLGCASAPPEPSVAPAASLLPDPLAAGWRGARVCERLREDETLRVLRCSFPPGVGHERHFHAAHWGYALAGGRMRIVDGRGAREIELATGSSFASPGVDWHEVENIGATTVVYLIVEPKAADPSAAALSREAVPATGRSRRRASRSRSRRRR